MIATLTQQDKRGELELVWLAAGLAHPVGFTFADALAALKDAGFTPGRHFINATIANDDGSQWVSHSLTGAGLLREVEGGGIVTAFVVREFDGGRLVAMCEAEGVE
jgi:hypothetical protein